VDDHGSADDIPDAKPVGEKAHFAVPVIGKQCGEIARVIAVGLIRRIPMPIRGFERTGWIAHLAYSVFMYVKPMGADRRLTALRRLISGQSAHFDADFRTCREIPEGDHSVQLRRIRAAGYFRICHSAFASTRILIIIRISFHCITPI
jgi:hypothetical protein